MVCTLPEAPTKLDSEKGGKSKHEAVRLHTCKIKSDNYLFALLYFKITNDFKKSCIFF